MTDNTINSKPNSTLLNSYSKSYNKIFYGNEEKNYWFLITKKN